MMWFAPTLLAGRAALITGGGTGIGREIALAFAGHGCDVGIVSRTAEHLDPTAAELRQAGGRAFAATADVRDAEGMRRVVDEAAAAFGRLDILVNGAAGNFLCRAEDLSPGGFGAVVDIDLKGTFHASRAAFPHLRGAGGVILNISATLHYHGTPGQLHVSSAKAGVDALTRNLAVEWAPFGIRVNAVAPGPIADTEGARRLLAGGRAAALATRVPLGRLGRAAEIASAALFLCSPASDFVTGAILVVDGGLHLASGWPLEGSPPGGAR